MRLSDMIAQEHEAAKQQQQQQEGTGQEHLGHNGPQAAAASAAPQYPADELRQEQALLLGGRYGNPGGVRPSAAAPADQATSRQRMSGLAQLKASRTKQQLSKQQQEGESMPSTASVSREGAPTASGIVLMKGDLDCDVNRWDLLQRGNSSCSNGGLQ